MAAPSATSGSEVELVEPFSLDNKDILDLHTIGQDHNYTQMVIGLRGLTALTLCCNLMYPQFNMLKLELKVELHHFTPD